VSRQRRPGAVPGRLDERCLKVKKADLITGVVLLSLSGYVIWDSLNMPASLTFGPGSGFLPFWLGVLLAALAILLMVMAVRSSPAAGESTFPGWSKLKAVLLILLGLTVFTLLMEPGGFFLTTLFFVFFLMMTVGRERWPKASLTAVLTAAALWIVFQWILGISLPKNFLGF